MGLGRLDGAGRGCLRRSFEIGFLEYFTERE